MLLAEWSEARPIEGMTFEIHRIEGRAPVLFAEIPRRQRRLERRHRVSVRTPRQAAGAVRLARGARSVDAGDRRRSPVRAWRRRRRLRDVRIAHRHPGSTADGLPAHSMRRADRSQRGERQPRSSGSRGGARRSDRYAEPDRVPRLRVPRLRPSVGHHLATRSARRTARRQHLHRGRALRRRQRRDPVDVPHRSPDPVADRGPGHRRDHSRSSDVEIPDSASASQGYRCRDVGRRCRQVRPCSPAPSR